MTQKRQIAQKQLMPVPLSVIMTVFNGEKYLHESVSSILNQTYRDFQFVVVDDGSTDSSLNMLKSFRDDRMHIVPLSPRRGRTAALNVALSEAQGKLVAVQDADDVSLPQRLEIQKAYMDQHTDVALLAAQSELILADGTHHSYWLPPIAHSDILERSTLNNPFAHSSVMYKREAAVELGSYPLEYVWAQDYALWISFLLHFRSATIPSTLVQIRLHPQQMSLAPAEAVIRLDEEYRLRHQAADHPDLSPRTRRLGRARARLERAVSLSCIGRSKEAFGYFIKSCLLYADVCMLDGRYVIPAFLRLVMGRPRLRSQTTMPSS